MIIFLARDSGTLLRAQAISRCVLRDHYIMITLPLRLLLLRRRTDESANQTDYIKSILYLISYFGFVVMVCWFTWCVLCTRVHSLLVVGS